MITFSTKDFDWQNNTAMRKFYQNILAVQGVTANSPSISPFYFNGDFSVSLTSAVSVLNYFDIGNFQLGVLAGATISNYAGRSFYHGNLKTNTYVFSGNANATAAYIAYLVSGPVSNLSHWLFKARNPCTPAGSDPSVNVNGANNFIDQFDDIFFNLLRLDLTSAVVPSGVVIEIEFMGFRIDY